MPGKRCRVVQKGSDRLVRAQGRQQFEAHMVVGSVKPVGASLADHGEQHCAPSDEVLDRRLDRCAGLDRVDIQEDRQARDALAKCSRSSRRNRPSI